MVSIGYRMGETGAGTGPGCRVPVPRPSASIKRRSTSHIAKVLAERLERFTRGDLADEFYVIPGLFDLAWRLHLRDVGVLDHGVVLLADLSVAGEEVVKLVAFQRGYDLVRVV